jgi:hypothetical protein
MNVYRLDPLKPGHPSWRYSAEKDTVWACAATAQAARDLVTAKSGFAKHAPADVRSPWRDATVTSCDLDPTITLMDPQTVVREDGSLVDFEK